MLTDAYENKLKSMQAELDETYQMVKESGQNLNVLNTQRKQLEDDLERTVSMNEQLTISKEKYLKMSMRLQDEKDVLEGQIGELTQEIQRLEMLAANHDNLNIQY